MIRLFHVYFPSRTLLLAMSEAALAGAVLVAAVVVRTGSDAELALVYERGFLKIAVASIVLVLCMYYYDLYDSLLLSNLRASLTRLVQVLGTTSLVLAVLYYMYPGIQLGRVVFLSWIPLAGVVLAFWRRFFLAVNGSTYLNRRTILLGEGPLAPVLAGEIEKRPELGMTVVGYLADRAFTGSLNGLARLGAIEEVAEVIPRDRIERVIITLGDGRGTLPVETLLRFKAQSVAIEDAANVYEAITGKVPIESLRPSWLLLSDGFRISPAVLSYKRVFSLVASVLGLVVASPLMAVIAILIRLDSPGPVIFRQQRIGKGGKPFTLYKFRSMWDRASESDEPTPAAPHDSRVTRVGHWLRRLRLDELPQLYNILRGDMDFVGPRPFAVSAEQELAQKIPFYTQRWNVKPGATGWAQIQRGYCASLEDNIEKLGYDLFYIKNVSVGLDWLILFHTIKILLLGRGAR